MKMERPKSKQPIPSHAKKVFGGVIFDVYQWEQELYDGSKVIFEKLKRSDTVVIFPVLPDKKILLVEDSQPGRQTVLTAPAGRVDKGEDVVFAAERELLEETGYEADLRLWKAFHPATKIDWVVWLFIGKNCRKVRESDPGSGEKIKERITSFEELLDLTDNPKFQNEGTIVDLLQAKLDPRKMEELKKLFFE